jgi:DNA repair exonuclease SbcCD ATPase subunit
MYFIRLISILIIFSTLSGCEFNIERVQELQSQIKTLEEKNEKLTNQLKSNKNAILSKNAELESCLIEVEKHESGLAEKHDFWFKVGIMTILSFVVFLFCWIKFDYYLTEKKAPKKEEIEKSRNLIENEKSLVENERVKFHQLMQNKASLLSEIEHLNEELEEKKEEVAREMEEEDRKLEKKKEEVARGIEEAEQQRQAALEKVAAAENKLKLLSAFKK